MKSIAVLQARTTSSRLPGKVMLPIRGIPIVVLAAQRAANTGRQVVVATSRESTDDALALLVQQHGLKCSRGSLDNTLSRVVDALSGYDEDTLVFRLTADNVFPDGSLLDEIEEEFKRRNLNYICCNGERSGLPYGMSAELTFLKHLRKASISTDCRYDQEHVTPYIRRTFGEYFFEKYRCINRSRFRCTIDCLDDYLGIQSVFSEVKDPINASAHDLSKRLADAPYQPFFEKLAPKLVLGTAQLGLSYGIANKYGKPDRVDAVDIIKTAIANGTAYIDTARAYGDSEDTIGDVLKAGWEGRAKIVTKLSPMLDCEATASIQTVKAHVDASIFGSCSALCVKSLDVLMLHRASHIDGWGGMIWDRLLELNREGIIKELGVSVQSPNEIERVLELPEIAYIQLPFNVLDWRWDFVIPKIREIQEKRKLIIHVRSTLLQGLLQSQSSLHWQKANVKNFAGVVEWLTQQTHLTSRRSVADFCLGYVNSLDWVDGIVVGVENKQQLIENIESLCFDHIAANEMVNILSSRPKLEERSLDPAQWG